MLGGPRRTALAAGITVAIASLATTRGLGPFDSPYQLQTFLALCVLPVLLLQAVMAERDAAIDKARGSDERYRAFIANSSEAIFRTELAEPMPVTLSPDDQIAWVRKHGFVAECNTAFMVALGVKDAPSPIVGTRLGDHPDLVARSISSASAKPSATATRCATSSTWCTGLTASIACC